MPYHAISVFDCGPSANCSMIWHASYLSVLNHGLDFFRGKCAKPSIQIDGLESKWKHFILFVVAKETEITCLQIIELTPFLSAAMVATSSFS